MSELVRRLQQLAPVITKISELSGTPGVSVGILHENQVIYTAGFGYRDIARELRPDEHTLFHIASLSKAFTGAAIGILAHDKKVDLNDPVHLLLPNYTHENLAVRSEATLLDHLSHRTGLAQKSAIWLQDWADLLLAQEELFPTLAYTESVYPLRSQWFYSNWGYCVAASVIEKCSGKTWAEFLTDYLFEPLGMKNTTMKRYPDGDNVAQAYQAYPDGTFSLIEPPPLVAGSIMQGSAGVVSSVSDLLVFYKALIKAWKHEIATNSTSTPGLPLKDVRASFYSNIPLEKDTTFQQSYGIGWAVSELPAPLGQIGTNSMFVPNMPIVGKGSQKRTVWHHNGSLVGFFSSVHILPDSDTAIIVLTNSLANNDCADWIGQLLLEAVLDNPDKNDYVKLAEESANSYRSMWGQLKIDWEKGHIPNTTPRPIKQYVGRYYNKIRNWFVEVEEINGELEFKFQGWPSQSHKLEHYHHDTFSWLMNANESISKGRWPDLSVSVYLFHFEAQDKEDINTLRWEHDWAVPEGEIFTRVSSTPKVDDQKMLGMNTKR